MFAALVHCGPCSYYFRGISTEGLPVLNRTLLRPLFFVVFPCIAFAQGNRLELDDPVFPQYSPAQRLTSGDTYHSARNRSLLQRKFPSGISNFPIVAIDTAHLEWMTRYASGLAPSSDFANAIAFDGSGNVFVTGSSTHLPYGTDITTIKYDSTGKQVWLQRFAENSDGNNCGVAVALTAASEAYVAGYILGTDGSLDWAIVKYSSSGSIQWKARYAGASASADVPIAIKVDSHENLIVTGYGDSEFITIKYDASGNQRWVRRYQSVDGASGHPAALAIDKSDNIYVTGSVGIAYLFDYMTVKYDSSGNQIWLERYDGPAKDEDVPAGIAVDDSGNVYVTGYVTIDLSRTIAFGTIKYNSLGVQQWIGLYSAGQHVDRASDIAIDMLGNVYVAGRSDSLHFGDGLLLKYGPSGTLVWKNRYDAGSHDEFIKVVTDPQNNVIVTGTSRVISADDFVTVKYDSAGSRKWIARSGVPGSPTGLGVDRIGNIYVVGAIQGNGYDYGTLKYNPSGAQQWVVRYDGIGSTYESPREMTVDAGGNTYITGVSMIASGDAVFTMKYSPGGVLQWVARYNGSSTRHWPVGIKVDGAGNVYVLATNWLNSGYDYVTLKYDTQGNEQWAARFAHVPGGDNYAVALDLDQKGNVIVTGSAYEVTAGHITTVKYSPEGKQLWIARYPIGTSSGDTPQAIIVNPQGEVFITGARQGECITLKYSSDGEEEWAAHHLPATYQMCWAYAIALDRQGNILVTGACDLGTMNADCLTLKYNPLGKLVWTARYDGPTHKNDYGQSIVVDAAGNAYVAGNSFGVSHNTSMLIKYSPNGTQQWVQRPGLAEGSGNWMSSVEFDNSANILLNATYSESLRTTTFSPDGTERRTIGYALSGIPAFDRSGNMHVAGVARVGPQLLLITAEFSMSPLPPPIDSLSIPFTFAVSQNFPNPFNGSTIINFTLTKVQRVDLRIYDALGRLVTTLASGELEQGDHYAVWNAKDTPSGIYFYRMQAGEFVETKKMILVK